jgi:hypothetical protein
MTLLQSRPAEPVACWPHVASGDNSNKKMCLNPFLGKAEIEHQSSFENLKAVYLWRHML